MSGEVSYYFDVNKDQSRAFENLKFATFTKLREKTIHLSAENSRPMAKEEGKELR